jgi:hypothetical protein
MQLSDTYLHTVPREESSEPAPVRRRVLSRWLIWALLLPVLLWMASATISLMIQHSGLRSRFTARLEAAFGRPVEVGSYDFSFWDGPALEAHSVRIAEDPRFGHEYFLRAESMAVRLRWQSLLRGHLAFGTLSLIRPSLNLVRNARGQWNLAEWLPRPSEAPAGDGAVVPAPAPPTALHFRRIEVNDGRIDFKRGDEKLPLAFVGVSGTVETDSPGRWRISLEASPWRAAVIVQQAGSIYVSGHVGGTSSRLRPAALNVSWTDASVSDVLRLVRGDDYGVRGTLALSMSARTQDQGDGWALQGRAELRQIHRWDLALRPDNPSVNLFVRSEWHPAASSLDLQDVAFEAPHSNARASGRIFWNRAGVLRAPDSAPVQLSVSSATIDGGDLLAWMRAFRSGVADSLSVRGLAEVRAEISGWPLRIVNATVSSEGVDVSGVGLRRPVRLEPIRVRYDRGFASFAPATLSWRAAAGTRGGSFRIDGRAIPPFRALPAWHVAGSTSQVRDLIAMAGAFGWNLGRGWELQGPLSCDLRFEGPPELRPGESLGLPMTRPVGWIELGAPPASGGGASLRTPFLNRPVEQIRARADLQPGSRHIALESAQAFNTHWSGSFDRREMDTGWQFALSGDSLSAADLDRWLNPRWRESFLGRVLPFLSPRPPANVEPENLAATGHLSLSHFDLAPFDVRRLQGNLKIVGRQIELADATGQFYGGAIGGSLDADLRTTPVYHANLNFSRVDMSSLLAATSNLTGLRAESAAGQILFNARGATRADLVDSLGCQGNMRVAGPELLNLDLWEALGEKSSGTGSTRFPAGSAKFSCSRRRIEFQEIDLVSGVDSRIEGSGSVSFDRNVDLRFRVKPATVNSGVMFRLSGALASPRVTRISPPAARRTR